jgi:1-deoxy-D-xylulose-5-phosphate synthase
MVYPALEAAGELEKEGLSLAVINARFARPLDEEAILPYAQKGNAVITVEEGVVSGGFGSAVREILDRERRFDLRFLAIGLPPEVYPLGKAEQIRKMFGLDAVGLAGRIRRFFGE